MAEILRLKRWTTYLSDGRSSASYSTKDKSVAVAVIVGHEPAKIESDDQFLNVDDVIIDLANHILEARKRARKRRK